MGNEQKKQNASLRHQQHFSLVSARDGKETDRPCAEAKDGDTVRTITAEPQPLRGGRA